MVFPDLAFGEASNIYEHSSLPSATFSFENHENPKEGQACLDVLHRTNGLFKLFGSSSVFEMFSAHYIVKSAISND